MPVTRLLSIVLAGGEGKRLMPLTLDRAKPAVPFGGHYRLIDFVLSNLANAGLLKIVVLTQYKSHSLDLHISRTWRMSTLLGNYVAAVPAQMRRGPQWFSGSADAVFQNLNIIGDERPDYILVFGADHIYRMDPRQMLEQHIATGAGVTVAGIRVPLAEANQFGVIEPEAGEPHPHLPREARVGGGPARRPRPGVRVDGQLHLHDPTSSSTPSTRTPPTPAPATTWAATSSPCSWTAGEAHVYDFADNQVPGATDRDRGYWRDVGTLDSYYDANMDLVSVHPVFNLYNREWPIYTADPRAAAGQVRLRGARPVGPGARLDRQCRVPSSPGGWPGARSSRPVC